MQYLLHGFLFITPGATGWSATAYDAIPTGTLNSATAVGALVTAVAAGALPFQSAGDIVFTNGLTILTTQGTAGAFKVIYL